MTNEELKSLKIQRWGCFTCERRSLVRYLDREPVSNVIRRMHNSHSRVSPKCTGSLQVINEHGDDAEQLMGFPFTPPRSSDAPGTRREGRPTVAERVDEWIAIATWYDSLSTQELERPNPDFQVSAYFAHEAYVYRTLGAQVASSLASSDEDWSAAPRLPDLVIDIARSAGRSQPPVHLCADIGKEHLLLDQRGKPVFLLADKADRAWLPFVRAAINYYAPLRLKDLGL